MSTRFFTDHVVPMLTAAEGGYVDHPSDRGGPTNHGITEAVARRYGYTGPMRALPLSVALAIYEKQYVVEPGFDRVSAVSIPVAKELVDTGVNMGQEIAAEFLQRALNALNHQAADWEDLGVDGRIGMRTVAALGLFLAKRGAQGETVMLRMLNALQGARYVTITESRPPNEDFVYGWFLNRVVI
jgi:lysozyme family protein